MDENTIREAWTECELEEIDEEHLGPLIDPAVFKPLMDSDFVFEERPFGELWASMMNMDGVAFIEEPLDGSFRYSNVYVPSEGSYISIQTYPDRIKISPADMDCSYDAFKHVINQFEENVCELEFLGGLEAMDVE